MSSSRIVLFLIGVVLLIVVILSSNKIGLFLRDKFNKIAPPSMKIAAGKITPTPSTIPNKNILSPTPIKNTQTSQNSTNSKGGVINTDNGEIPATGPGEIVWIIMSGSFFSGIALNKIASKDKGKK
jgi:hypothetical protein